MTSIIKVDQIQNAAGSNAVDQSDLDGMAVADQYLLTSDLTADGTITSWQRPTDSSFGRKSGVTHASGTFSFPRTGLYMVSFFFKATVGASDNVVLNLQATTNNSTYDNIAQANCSSSGGLDNSGHASTFVNVNDIVNVKCKLGVISLGSGTSIRGTSNEAITAITFLRISGSV